MFQTTNHLRCCRCISSCAIPDSDPDWPWPIISSIKINQNVNLGNLPSGIQTWQWTIPYKWRFIAGKNIFKVVNPPSVVSWFITTVSMSICISTTNHSHWSYLHQLSDLAHWGTTTFDDRRVFLSHSPGGYIGLHAHVRQADEMNGSLPVLKQGGDHHGTTIGDKLEYIYYYIYIYMYYIYIYYVYIYATPRTNGMI